MDLTYLSGALIVDGDGKSTNENLLLHSEQFDEIRNWSDQVYMPYTVDPISKRIYPKSTLHAIEIGSMVISRFTYGIPVHLHDFSQDKGVGMVLTTLSGNARHWQDAFTHDDTTAGETFIVDNSQVDYHAHFDPKHLQLNVTFEHDYLNLLYKKITGHYAPPEFWQNKVKFGKNGSGWLSLLEYVIRMANENSQGKNSKLLAKHLEETLGTNILLHWADACGIDIENTHHKIAPNYIIKAEAYMRDHAVSAPTLSEVAMSVGVSTRALHKGFKVYRNSTPMRYLRDIRLEGIRTELKQAPMNVTVSEIAYSWGYVSLGRFAKQYKEKFGELPSDTRKFRPCK